MAKKRRSTHLTIVDIAMRTAPSRDRPRLSEELELRLDPIERRKAECYASMEQMTHSFDSMAQDLREALDGIEDEPQRGVAEMLIAGDS